MLLRASAYYERSPLVFLVAAGMNSDPAARDHCVYDPLYGQYVSGLTHVDVVLPACVEDGKVCRRDSAVQLSEDLRFVPGVHGGVLDHLEVRDGDAAGVAEDVRYEVDTSMIENVVGCRRRGAVGEFRDYSCLDPRCGLYPDWSWTTRKCACFPTVTG